MAKIIRSSSHSMKCLNKTKHTDLNQFLVDCNNFLSDVIDDIWNYGYTDGKYVFDIKNNLFDLPSMLKDKFKHIDSPLTARMRKCILTQASGMLRSATEKQRKRLYQYKTMKDEGKSKRQMKFLIKAIKQNVPQKPNSKNTKFEINSICSDFTYTSQYFFGFIRLKSIYKDRKEIKLPIQQHRHLHKMVSNGKLLNQILLQNDAVDLRWEIEPRQSNGTKKLGCDQGIKTLITATNSDNITMELPEKCPHGHNVEQIIEKMSKKRKGSKAFKRAVAHRKNFINYIINQMDLSDIDEVLFEEIVNINKGKNVSRKLKHWTNTDIRDAMKLKCEELGVRFTLQSCTYRSQRCQHCGLVRKSNRKGKIYICKSCGYIDDADINASKNHLANLPEIPYNLRKMRFNLKSGFYWKPDGYYDVDGGHLQFPLPDKTEIWNIILYFQ